MAQLALDRARQTVHNLAVSLDTPYHGSSLMTGVIYDTAWLAMVVKSENEENTMQSRWLFPSLYYRILECQSPSGAFGQQEDGVDGILNTMAALLALRKLERNPSIVGGPAVLDISERIDQGRAFLESALVSWDVSSTVHVGFEILVPNLINLLHDEGVDFRNFPGYPMLVSLNQQKLAKFQPELLYMQGKTTLIHSLEAFIGHIDFDRVSHHLVNGAMMNSPSSTAAYLMNCSTWDAGAVSYLRFVASERGMIPSAFPTSIFETSWILSTFLESGLTVHQLGDQAVCKLADFLQSHLQEQNGICGFAPATLPDADDTAKCILTLSLVGRKVGCTRMLESFETPTHFKTYKLETSHSFSANCNVLKALLGSSNPSDHTPSINKALKYLVQTWQSGSLRDKWNLSPHYSMMLLSDAVVTILKLWDGQELNGVPFELLRSSIPAMVFQVLIQTINFQKMDGSWESSLEATAYAVLTLKRLASLPWAGGVRRAAARAILHGTAFLMMHEEEWDAAEFLWVEKVSYGSEILSRTYCIAAITASDLHQWGNKVFDIFSRARDYSQFDIHSGIS